jgi:uncharacterized membrane protein YqhA
MRSFFKTLKSIVILIALLVFLSGVVLTVLAIYDFVASFSLIWEKDKHQVVVSIAVAMLRAVDLFLIAIVFYVFSIGLMVLFHSRPDGSLPVILPKWLRVENFMELKVILWEAILTTLVVTFLATLAETKMQGGEINEKELIVPVSVLLFAISLYFLKKGEHHNEAGK